MPRTVYLVFFSDDDYELFVREADVLSTEQDEV
jgi:hypothetical protein